jgi:hypothetical protein
MPQPPSQRAYKSLSEAILHGCRKHRIQPRTPNIGGGREGRGALQAAWFAQFPDADPSDYLPRDLFPVYPELQENFGTSCPSGPNTSCPEWPERRPRTLEQAVIHLEDIHGFTRETVAAWVREHGF